MASTVVQSVAHRCWEEGALLARLWNLHTALLDSGLAAARKTQEQLSATAVEQAAKIRRSGGEEGGSIDFERTGDNIIRSMSDLETLISMHSNAIDRKYPLLLTARCVGIQAKLRVSGLLTANSAIPCASMSPSPPYLPSGSEISGTPGTLPDPHSSPPPPPRPGSLPPSVL